MDDDDFRRGKPSCHKAYGESVAILAGDALLTLAFEVMARATVEEAHLSRKVRCIEEVGRMAGAEGMVGGQVLDVNYEQGKATEEYYDKLILMKTAGLITASVRAGAILGGADPVQLESFSEYGRNIGLAFQTRDDILDSKEDSPLKHGDRPNSVVFFGFEKAERRLHSFVEKGIRALESISMATPELRCLAEMLLVYNSGTSQ
jgi:geranylgeranyl diphosphate synthase type II